MNTHQLGLAAFIATGLAFAGVAEANQVRKPLKMNKRRQQKQETQPIDDDYMMRLIDFDMDDYVAPVSLRSAKTAEDTEQAWRTVRSYFGMEIFIEFDIGTPGQTLRILIDSGSDWFWVTSERCRQCGGIKRYDSKKSQTYKLVGTEEVRLEYGSGAAWGDHIQETVCLSQPRACEGFFCVPVCVTDMDILSIHGQGSGLQALVSDGLMGLSPVKIGDNRPDLFVESAYEQGSLDERVFSLNFAGDYETSYITFGGYDVNEFAVEEITWHDNLGKYFWSVGLDKVKFGNRTAVDFTTVQSNWWGNGQIVVDSGSSYILMPRKFFWEFYKEIKRVSGATCEVDWWNTLYCLYDEEIYKKLPEMTFTLNSKDYTVPRESLYVPLEGYEDQLLVVEITYINGWNEWLFGLTFLQNYYAVYDMENQRVGFALSKSSSMATQQRHVSAIAATQLLETAIEEPESEQSSPTLETSLGVAGSLLAVGLLARSFFRRNKAEQPSAKIPTSTTDEFTRISQI